MPTMEENQRREERAKVLARLTEMAGRVEQAMDHGELSTKEGVNLLLRIEAQRSAVSGVRSRVYEIPVIG